MDFAGGFIKHGDDDPIEKMMEDFLKEPFNHEDIHMPRDVITYK
jgi:hypothetical protein